jgi:phage-related baseplate assembly protein
MPTAPTFIDTDVDAIVARLVSKYEADTGRALEPAQAERLLINMVAYEVKIVREQLQAAAEQMLVSFAVAPALDFLAELVGVVRLPAAGALTNVLFTVAPSHPGVLIPAGTRVVTSDGQVIFRTVTDLTITSSNTTGTVSAVATTTGVGGNDYAIGDVSGILDPLPYLVSVSNTTVTASGADAETDEALRTRVKLAPSAFSVAGPTNAYKYFALQVSPTIIDVSVLSSVPGTVQVYPLVTGGIATPAPILTAVLSALSAEDVRPLTDTVTVLSPTLVAYDIEVEITTYTDADEALVVAQATEALTAYAAARGSVIGQDVKRSQITALSVGTLGSVFDVTVVAPAADVVVDGTEVPVVGTITVTVTGQTNG